MRTAKDVNERPVVFEFAYCRLMVFPEAHYCETVFNDGTKASAAPQDNDEYRERACDLGYGTDTWAMCLEHELFHTLIARTHGLNYSHVLWDVAHGLRREDHWIEENEVLDFQRRFRAAINGGKQC